MRNRDGVEYDFEKVAHNQYTIVGELKHWRLGGLPGQSEIDVTDLGFVDPAGGPFIAIGQCIRGKKIVKIREHNNSFIFEVESDEE